MRYITDKILVVDLEATCWGNDIPPEGSQTDILAVGICALQLETGEITDKELWYVIPERSEISEYCTELTGITPEIIRAEGLPLAEVCERIRTLYEPEKRLWAGYGSFDQIQMESQCRELEIPFPMGDSYLNIMPLFSAKMKVQSMRGLKRALRMLNEPFDGIPHNAADDAYNAAKVLRHILS